MKDPDRRSPLAADRSKASKPRANSPQLRLEALHALGKLKKLDAGLAAWFEPMVDRRKKPR